MVMARKTMRELIIVSLVCERLCILAGDEYNRRLIATPLDVDVPEFMNKTGDHQGGIRLMLKSFQPVRLRLDMGSCERPDKLANPFDLARRRCPNLKELTIDNCYNLNFNPLVRNINHVPLSLTLHFHYVELTVAGDPWHRDRRPPFENIECVTLTWCWIKAYARSHLLMWSHVAETGAEDSTVTF